MDQFGSRNVGTCPSGTMELDNDSINISYILLVSSPCPLLGVLVILVTYPNRQQRGRWSKLKNTGSGLGYATSIQYGKNIPPNPNFFSRTTL